VTTRLSFKEDSHHTRRSENLKSHQLLIMCLLLYIDLHIQTGTTKAVIFPRHSFLTSGVTTGRHVWQDAKSPGPMGSPASELKTLKIYLSAEYNYLKYLSGFFI
jgi:hypothetical protein